MGGSKKGKERRKEKKEERKGGRFPEGRTMCFPSVLQK